jgi:drug/metabolite transporter (DMT)-like permease
MPRRAWLLLLLLASLWGASYLFIKLALEDLSPAMIVFVRTALAATVLAPFAARRGAFAGVPGRVGPITILALIQIAVPFLLISAGEQEISSSLAGILVASAPIFTAVLAVWIDHEEQSSGSALAGVVIGIVGVGLLLGVDVGGRSGALLGGLAVVLASLGYALGGFYLKHRLGAADPVGVAAQAMVASALLTLPFALATAPSSIPGLEQAAAVTALGIGGTGISFVIFYTLIADVGPARASLVAYIAPGFAVAYGVTLLNEPFTGATFAGLVLILAGSWLAAGGLARPEAAPGPPADGAIDSPAPGRARRERLPARAGGA